jgi:hypothetical protein
MFGFFRRHPHPRDDDLLRVLIKHVFAQDERIHTMANDLTKLQAAVTALEARVAALPPPAPDQQPAIDDLTTRVDAVTAALPAPVPTP